MDPEMLPAVILIAGKAFLTWALPLAFAAREIWLMRKLRRARQANAAVAHPRCVSNPAKSSSTPWPGRSGAVA
jgi:hypothetical protein